MYQACELQALPTAVSLLYLKNWQSRHLQLSLPTVYQLVDPKNGDEFLAESDSIDTTECKRF